jgi:hypothetical protein
MVATIFVLRRIIEYQFWSNYLKNPEAKNLKILGFRALLQDFDCR